MKKLAILASGSGTNAENIHKFFSRGSRVAVDMVIYDRKDAGVAERMAQYGVETIYIPASVWRERPQEIVDMLQQRGIDLVVLAGFLRMIPSEMTAAFDHRMVNIHPSLLPAYGGKGMYGHKVHEAVMAAGEKKSGVTVHYVTDVVDGGEIVMQEEVEITEQDTAETLEQKIHQVEYSLFPRAIVKALQNLEPQEPQHPHIEQAQTEGSVPPPMPPEEEWAQTLGITNPKITPHPAKQPPQYSANPEHSAQTQQAPLGMQTPKPSPMNSEPMPPTNLVWSVLATVLCCFIPGVVAIIMSSRVSAKYYAGDIEGAKRASRASEYWIIASFILGLLTATLYLPIMLIAG